jgi:hypothetical protein
VSGTAAAMGGRKNAAAKGQKMKPLENVATSGFVCANLWIQPQTAAGSDQQNEIEIKPIKTEDLMWGIFWETLYASWQEQCGPTTCFKVSGQYQPWINLCNSLVDS